MNRPLLALFSALALTGCGSDAPPRYEQQETSEAEVASGVVLGGDGVNAGPEAFLFGAGRAEVETAIAAVLGEAMERSENRECGAGPMQFTDFDGGLSLNFQDDRLVGWFWNSASEDIATTADVGIGTDQGELAETSGFAMLPDSTLGEEFSIGAKLGGFIDQGKVSGLYAGVNCFFR